MVCGFGDSVSYEQLVQKVTGGRIDKSSRFTDWRRRPLTEKQLEYALADVTHLIDIYHYLVAELERENRAHWLTEEMSVLTAPRHLRSRSGGFLEAAQAARAQAARAGGAGRSSLPGASSRRAPATCRASACSRMTPSTRSPSRPRATPRRCRACAPSPKGWERSSTAATLLEIVNEALDLPREEMPEMPKQVQLPEGTAAATELLKVLLKLVADKEGVAAKMLASGDDLDRIAAHGEGSRRRRTRRLAA